MLPVQLFVVVLAFALGACIGSFLNVVLWRVPRGESVVSPPSRCPGCGQQLGPRELVPVLSWVAQRGRCRHCEVRISARYPLVELGTGVLFAVVAWLVVS
jgi:prepilin signal peptidase PulO-like enzyme (type II secretory pathway)